LVVNTSEYVRTKGRSFTFQNMLIYKEYGLAVGRVHVNSKSGRLSG
jgi:hypothetical protein